MSDVDTADDEETKRINVAVPQSVHETAKKKLEYGGISREVRDTLRRVAFGEDMNQRSRLEHQLTELQDERDELRAERREIDAKIETIETRITGIQNDISQLSTEEERYESKLEELEYRVREDGTRLFAENTHVERVAKAAEREPEAVVNDLKERNPDIPDYAFEEGDLYRENQSWTGVPDEDVHLAVEDREQRYR